MFRCGGEQPDDANETITTFCGPVEFRLRVRPLLVMWRAYVSAARDYGGIAMFVMISSILDTVGR